MGYKENPNRRTRTGNADRSTRHQGRGRPYGENNLIYICAGAYIRKFLDNTKVVRFLNAHYSALVARLAVPLPATGVAATLPDFGTHGAFTASSTAIRHLAALIPSPDGAIARSPSGTASNNRRTPSVR
jgi:hypothetical protein